jgi:uncharacterized membrane protein
MENLLLVALFCLLIYIINTIKSRFNNLEEDIQLLNKKIDLLRKQEQPEDKPATTSFVIPKEEIKFEKTVTPETIPVPTVKEDIPQLQPEKVVFSQDTRNTPVSQTAIKKPLPPSEPGKSFWENFKEQNPDLEKFIGENLINKIGVLILVLGISYFVKYAIDKDWINEPARVGIGILSGTLVMGIAHKLRKNYTAFSSVIVAGAIAIFYFTIGIAFHDYHLFNQTVAFSIMVVITAYSALISLSYNRIELAVLSLIGGFAVPFMVSTGSGNYIVLFIYIIILNTGILAIAYHKKWNLVNILTYIFTVFLYGGWLADDLTSNEPHYEGALLFGFAFYFIFILMNIVNNIRTKGEFSNAQLTVLASNTFLFYAAGMAILSNFHPEFRGLFTTLLALLNLTYAWLLYKKFGLDKKAVYLLIGLTLTFITLAIPIQFEGNYITLFWAAEAVLLLWLSQKSKVTSYKFGSVVVHGLMIISLMMDWVLFYNSSLPLNIIINPIFITGAVAFLSLLAIRMLLKNETEDSTLFGIPFNPESYSKYVLIASIIIAYFTGLLETIYQSNSYINPKYSAAAFPGLYHLLFCSVVAFICIRQKTTASLQLASIIAISSIVLFTFGFSNYAFFEHQYIIATGNGSPIAFYLHYLSLALVLYAGYQIFQIQKSSAFAFFRSNYFIWIAAFLIIYIASSEVMLHGLVLLDSSVTVQNIQDSPLLPHYKNELPYLRELIAQDFISLSRTKIIKTGFPVLWGILAFVFLIAGIKKQIKTLRIIALSLLGLTILKLFVYDISNISETGKIISFILLGILILIISFVYQKIKVLVIDDSKPGTTHETK